jgi:hypothetical protein
MKIHFTVSEESEVFMKKILSTILAITMVAVMAVSALAATKSPSSWYYDGADNKLPEAPASTPAAPAEGPKVQETSDGTIVVTTDNGDVVLEGVDDWCKDDVIAIIAKGLMVGYPDGKFHPQDNVTVAMVYTVLARIAGADITTTGDDWIANVTAWAAEKGIADDADPNSLATRGQMVKYLASLDAADTDSLEWALANDILRGYEDGSLKLDNLMTRAEFAAFLNRYIALTK